MTERDTAGRSTALGGERDDAGWVYDRTHGITFRRVRGIGDHDAAILDMTISLTDFA